MINNLLVTLTDERCLNKSFINEVQDIACNINLLKYDSSRQWEEVWKHELSYF